MTAKKTHEEFLKEVYNLVKDEYLVFSEYKNARTKVEMFHKKCGTTFEMRPPRFIYGTRCPHCFGTFRKTTEEFKKEVYDLFGEEYEVLSDYKNNKTNVKMRHNKCGNVYEVRPDNFLHGSKCHICTLENLSKKRIWTTSEFKNKVYELVGDEYSLIEEYVNAKSKIKMKHITCGHIYDVRPSVFLQGSRCPKCARKIVANKKTKTHEEFVSEVKKIFGENEFEFIKPYKHVKQNIILKHNKCGHEFKKSPSVLLNGYGCPACSESLGEREISIFLKENNIKFKREFKLKDCIDKLPLRFDFALFNDNELVALIEYDGEQHFIPVNRFGGEKAFEGRVRKDKIKTDYCKTKGIPLIRIEYTVNDIPGHLDKKLNELETPLQLVLT